MHGKQKSPGPSPSDIQNLIATHLRQIWSQPLSSRRRALFEQVYHPEIIVYEHDGGVLTGFDHVDSKIEALTGQGGPFAGQEFRIDSEGIKWNGDFAWVGWELGPPTVAGGEEIEAKATGGDGILLDINEKGEAKIKAVWVIINGISDVKA